MEQVREIPSLLLLAAGSGTRMGGPKALLKYADGTALLTVQVERMLTAATARGCDSNVIVVLGPAADRASRLVPGRARIVENPEHRQGLSTSLRAGLSAVPNIAAGVVISLLDLPDVPAEAYGRLLDATVPEHLARAHWNSVPGHPVGLGRAHIAEAHAAAAGDEGLRVMLRRHSSRGGVSGIECADLLPAGRDGLADIDTPEAAARFGLHLADIHS
ncbi:NTP transferase domain-containing protein [Brevibacterium sp. JSBI002]|uniref:nucleotidyltransferase family protein n=1 Tax=Brevibacterium sp. JSBI002 TaxID=2886045 RepID=UPI002231ACC7|nr:nucleotidyltransferase family protein [Brevibacterium sp. JSBI002]UZD62202.1 nucleotidyltransferase family protein [Brevibacterium sp. JSBI002]